MSVTCREQESCCDSKERQFCFALTSQIFVSQENSFSDSSLSCCAENWVWIVTRNSLMSFKIIPSYTKRWCFTCPDCLCKPKSKCKAAWQDKKSRWFRRCSGNNEASETHPGSGTGRQWSHSPAMWLTLFSSFLSPANQTLKCRFVNLKWLKYFTRFLPLLYPNIACTVLFSTEFFIEWSWEWPNGIREHVHSSMWNCQIKDLSSDFPTWQEE